MNKSGKTIDELTREELEATATDYKVEFTADTTDDDLRELVNKAMDNTQPVTDEEIDKMPLEDLQTLAKGLDISFNKKTKDTELRKMVKEALKKASGDDLTIKTLKTVSDFMFERNIPSWQKAMILRANNWTDDKSVTEEEFKTAFNSASGRPLGGI